MENNENLLTVDLQVDSISFAHLHETARWAKFLAIVGFIIAGFLLLAAIFASSLLGKMSGAGLSSSQSVVGAGFLSAIYIVIAVIYFVMCLFLYRFAAKMQIALQSTDQENFNLSLHNLKLVYRITGIIVIVYLALMALALIFGVGAAAFMS